MTGPSKEVFSTDVAEAPLPSPAIERIAVLLRHAEAQIVAMKQEVSPDHRLCVATEVPDLDQVLAPLQSALYTAAEILGLEPSARDGRRALRAMLHILWANLIDMSPENLRRHWGVKDVPPSWPTLHAQLVAAAEGAIAQL
jgi:hypothetical protein